MSVDLPVIERAADDDAAEILSLLQACGVAAPTEKPSATWVARSRDQIVGTVALVETTTGCLLECLAVTSPWRRLGLGRALVERVEIDATVGGAAQVRIETGNARSFFSRLGYGMAKDSSMRRTLPPLIYHNPLCGTSRSVLALLHESDKSPRVIEYLKSPPDKPTLQKLVARSGDGVRALLRQKGTPYDELGLGDERWTDEQLIDRMLATPILINRPIVVTARGVKLCRPSQTVESLL